MVRWTKPANIDLREIFDYIARDSHVYARNVVAAIHDRATILNEFPRLGRVVPEINEENTRELIIYSYRIVYQVKDNNDVEILAVIHGKRDLSHGDISR